jgi:hypothetical protein
MGGSGFGGFPFSTGSSSGSSRGQQGKKPAGQKFTFKFN